MLSEGELERRVSGLREKYGAETNIAAFHKSWASLDLDARRKWIEDAKSMVKEEAVVVLGVPPPLLIGSCPELHGSDAWKSLESPPSMSSLLRGALLGSGMAVPLPPHLGGHGGKEDYVRMAARLGPRLATAEEERAFEAFHGRVWESCRAYFMCCFAVALCKRAALP